MKLLYFHKQPVDLLVRTPDLVDVTAQDYAQTLNLLRENVNSVLVALVLDNQVLFGLLNVGELVAKCLELFTFLVFEQFAPFELLTDEHQLHFILLLDLEDVIVLGLVHDARLLVLHQQRVFLPVLSLKPAVVPLHLVQLPLESSLVL